MGVKGLLHRLLRLAAMAGLVWAALVAALWLKQEWLIFRPHTLPADWVFDKGPDVHERWIEVPNGEGARLNALHLKLPRPDGVVFFLHGNGGSLEGWFVNLDIYRRANLDLFMIDYRGYGKSPCCITSEAQLHADVRAAWQAVAADYAGRGDGFTRVFYGRSLGTGLAAVLASEVQPDLTILASPYLGMAALADEHYPWVPKAVLRYPLSTAEALPRVKTPVLMLHGTEDRLIDISHSHRLKALAPGVRLVEVVGAGHNDVSRFEVYRDAVAAALEQARSR
ncbi:MAG: alpha/beta hydrolase [Rubrivivax sp.]|nr:alpha/beta hydrolase [Rubrivivax sp.]